MTATKHMYERVLALTDEQRFNSAKAAGILDLYEADLGRFSEFKPHAQAFIICHAVLEMPQKDQDALLVLFDTPK